MFVMCRMQIWEFDKRRLAGHLFSRLIPNVSTWFVAVGTETEGKSVEIQKFRDFPGYRVVDTDFRLMDLLDLS